MQRKRKTI